MARTDEIRKIAFIGDYLPRKCGIATFTRDLRNAVASQYPVDRLHRRARSTTCPEGYDYPPEVRFEFAEQDLDVLSPRGRLSELQQHRRRLAAARVRHLRRAGRQPRLSGCCATCGCRWSPRCTRCSREPNADQRRVLEELAELSARLVVMSERGRQFLQEVYGVPDHKIDLIAHGIPDMPFVDPNFYKDQFGVEGKHVLLTFGLLSPNKGIEYVLRALPEVIARVPELGLHRAGRHAPQPGARAGRELPLEPGATWPRTWGSQST